ncbi:MAG: L-arabinose isomerase [Bacteroidales bacterium]|nr:L-arabinose isomerase [Bacteroidales bacterium]MDT8431978.1 L-arabinose isomerase [Bacteroidales bacterium]
MNYEVWFITGSQHLYGEETLKQVANNSGEIVDGLNQSPVIPVRLVHKPVLTTPDAITATMQEANAAEKCIGIVTWMHTFSPAKMWINGFRILKKSVLHLHTQFNRDIPWESIDMDFMNLNQSAHGGREYGFLLSRLRRNRKVVVGHWKDKGVQERVGSWTRAALAWHDWQGMRVARFGDNMREVAVTEGDKVEAQIRFGYSVSGYGVGDLVAVVNAVSDDRVDTQLALYAREYELAEDILEGGSRRSNLREAARIELGMKDFLENGGFKAFTTTFEDLHGLKQLPGHAVQRLMAAGYGFGAEGDWKTAALVRAMKVMGTGLEGGTSFMEDYTYHLDPSGMKVLGAHMLEICPTIASGKASMEVHELGIGGKEDPIRLVFDVNKGAGINVSIMDMGNRFRMLVNPCKVVEADQPLPKLPVARVLWEPEPDLPTAAAAWIHAGGAHHTGFSMAVNAEMMEDFADMADMEILMIDNETRIRDFKKEIRWNDLYYHLSDGLKK